MGDLAMSVDFSNDLLVSAAVLTVSDTRTEETDKSGIHIKELLKQAGHITIHYAIVPDEQTAITRMIQKWLKNNEVDLIIVTGGTGIAPRDVTIETVQPF